MLTRINDAPGNEEDFTMLLTSFKVTANNQLHVHVIADNPTNPFNPYTRTDLFELNDGYVYMYATIEAFTQKFKTIDEFIAHLAGLPEWKQTNKPLWAYVVRNYSKVFEIQ